MIARALRKDAKGCHAYVWVGMSVSKGPYPTLR